MGHAEVEQLTRRERQVAALLAQGLSNKEIAGRLFISVRTAEFHVEHVRGKLGLRSRAQVASRMASPANESQPTSGGPPIREWEGLVSKGVQDPPRAYTVAVEQAPPRHDGKAAAPTEVAIPAQPPTSRRILCPELVGREGDCATLEALLREATAGRGRTVLVAGEAGVGKTAVFRAFSERAQTAGTRVLVGECTEIEARRPFGPFIEIVGSAGRDPSAASSGQNSSPNGGEVLGILPELGTGVAMSFGDTERYRVHAAFARFIGDLARDAAIVVAVEDLHWGDEATLELFPYLARKLRDSHVLLVGTYRSDELQRLHPLNRVLAELTRGRMAEEVLLRRLSIEQTGAVIRAALGLEWPPTSEFRAAIQARCEGNPFFIEEVLRALVDSGDLSYRDGAWRRTKDVFAAAIPVSIRDAVEQRMQLLSRDARRVMHVAAVIGQRFDFELLRRVTGLSEPALLEALLAGVDAQLVGEEAANGEEHYVFRHALTREGVLTELLQRQRRLLHRAVGEAIEATAGVRMAERAEELAYHFDQALDQERAFRYHELAAREAARLHASAGSVQHLERAIELAPANEPSLGDLQLRLADAAYQASDIARALRAAAEAHRIFQSAGDAHPSGSVLRRLSLYRWVLGETQAANKLAAEAVQLLQPLGESGELAAAYAELARQAMLERRSREAISWGQHAIEMARKTDTLEAQVSALNTVGTAMSILLADPGGLALIRQSLDLALRHELVLPARRAYGNLSAAMTELGFSDNEVQRINDEWARHADRYGVRNHLLITELCFRPIRDGDWDEALRLIEEGRDETIWSAGRELIQAFIETARQGPERARTLVDAPRGRLIAAGWPFLASAAWSVPVMLLAGDPRATLDHAEVLADLVSRNFPGGDVDLAALCAISAARTLQDEAATERWIHLAIIREDQKLASHSQRARDAFARAERSAGQGDLDAAVALLEESARHFSEHPMSYFASHTIRLRRADLLLQRGAPGDREAAQAELDPVHPYWQKAKATWYLGKLKEWAAERGLRFPDG